MNCASQTSPNMPIYALFESAMRNGIKSLAVQPVSIAAGIKYYRLPSFAEPLEEFELEVNFPEATCQISFEKATAKNLFFTMVYFLGHNQQYLSLHDFLVDRNDQRHNLLSFKISECTLEEGISRIVNVLVSLFNNELLPLLEGKTWFTAPFDWGDYK